MIKQISVFDDEKNTRLSYLPELDSPFELTSGNVHQYYTEEQLRELQKIIDEMLQTVNKRDW